MPSKNLSGSRRMLSAKLLSGLPEGLGVVTFLCGLPPLAQRRTQLPRQFWAVLCSLLCHHFYREKVYRQQMDA